MLQYEIKLYEINMIAGVGPATNVSISAIAPSFVHVSPSNIVLQQVIG